MSEVDLRKVPKELRPAPTQGQHAPERHISFKELNGDEQDVINTLNDKGHGPRLARHIGFLAEVVDSDDSETRLRVRNALRRLVSCGWAKPDGRRGYYIITERGRKRIARFQRATLSG